ncbi:MAG: hypothetical protein WBD40_00465 [Tepidisphaeraceae bacterium]
MDQIHQQVQPLLIRSEGAGWDVSSAPAGGKGDGEGREVREANREEER